MKKSEIFSAYADNIVCSYTRTPLVAVKGKGAYLWDIDGKKYLDFFPGWGVGNLGHCHPAVMAAVRDQIEKLVFVPNSFYTPGQAALARELNFAAKEPFKAFFCNSGTEANEAAIKLARKAGQGRYGIITFENAFHGRTLGSLSATCQEKYQKDFKPLLEGFVSVPFNNISAVKNAISDKTIAVMLELVQGEGGVNVADREFVSQLVRLCKDNGLLTIVDEVQTGIGRTGTMFAWQQYGFVPDIFTLAKALGGGLPIGAMMSRPALADLLTPGTHGSTFGGGPVISKAALAVLRAVQKEKLLSRAQKMGELLRSELLSLKKNSTCVKDVRGLGLMIGVELTVPGKPVVAECMASGLLINCTHDTVLRIMPPLGVSPWEIKQAVGILTNALEKVQS